MRPRKTPRWLAAVIVVTLLAMPALLTYGLSRLGDVSARVDRNEVANTRALCTLRSDLQTRVRDGIKFLKKHPRGIPGIPAATIRSSVAGEKRTVAALSSITCPRF